MPRKPSPAIRRFGLWSLAGSLYIIACAVLDVFPQHGPPAFRYTGAYPAFPVWNLGWPFPQFIYDPRFGLQVGPTAWVLVFLQGFALASGVAGVLAIQWFIRRRRHANRAFPVAT